jgi:hypothetical protein
MIVSEGSSIIITPAAWHRERLLQSPPGRSTSSGKYFDAGCTSIVKLRRPDFVHDFATVGFNVIDEPNERSVNTLVVFNSHLYLGAHGSSLNCFGSTDRMLMITLRVSSTATFIPPFT